MTKPVLDHAAPNIILIGMAGSGKSTIGALLAETTHRNFIDTDKLIERASQSVLQDILNRNGRESFLKLESDIISDLDCESSIIATGGSVVYSNSAMQHLKGTGKIVFLNMSLKELKQRALNFTTRGLIIKPGQSIDSLFEERLSLCRQWADITIACDGKSPIEICDEVSERLSN